MSAIIIERYHADRTNTGIADTLPITILDPSLAFAEAPFLSGLFESISQNGPEIRVVLPGSISGHYFLERSEQNQKKIVYFGRPIVYLESGDSILIGSTVGSLPEYRLRIDKNS